MLESISERLMETVHAGSPTKHPARRLETIEAAGRLRIPFTSGILVGIGETEEERIASLEALAEVNARHGHIQEIILQNFVPHPRYYGREVAEIADEAARDVGAKRGPAAPRPRRKSPVDGERRQLEGPALATKSRSRRLTLPVAHASQPTTPEAKPRMPARVIPDWATRSRSTT